MQKVQNSKTGAENLEVLQIDEEQYLVENQKGKSFVVVTINDEGVHCGCPGYAKASKQNPAAVCKHIEAAMNGASNGFVKGIEAKTSEKPQLDPRFIIEIDGQQFAKFQGLLDLGHQKGISQIEVEPMQLPTADNGQMAVCKATVISKNGESFTDIGDANPQNCNSKVGKHLLRLASTRSIARALRSYTNIGMTCLEELADLNDVTGNERSRNEIRKQASTSIRKNKTREPKAERARKTDQSSAAVSNEAEQANNRNHQNVEKPNPQQGGKTPQMSEAQRKAILNIGHRRGIPMDDLESMAVETFGVEFNELSNKDASHFIRQLQTQTA
jgi:hypothetical protein